MGTHNEANTACYEVSFTFSGVSLRAAGKYRFFFDVFVAATDHTGRKPILEKYSTAFTCE
jgi:hypothetical protein